MKDSAESENFSDSEDEGPEMGDSGAALVKKRSRSGLQLLDSMSASETRKEAPRLE